MLRGRLAAKAGVPSCRAGAGRPFVWSLLGALTIAASLVTQAHSQEIAPHAIWKDRCTQCHGPVGGFARKSLRTFNGDLEASRSGQALRDFLRGHHLPSEEVSHAVYEMLRKQTDTEPRFKSQCSACHGNAANLVRMHFVDKEGVAYGRTSGDRLDKYLVGHRNLIAEADVPFFIELLRSIQSEDKAQ